MSRVDELRNSLGPGWDLTDDEISRFYSTLDQLIEAARQEAHAQGFADGMASVRGIQRIANDPKTKWVTIDSCATPTPSAPSKAQVPEGCTCSAMALMPDHQRSYLIGGTLHRIDAPCKVYVSEAMEKALIAAQAQSSQLLQGPISAWLGEPHQPEPCATCEFDCHCGDPMICGEQEGGCPECPDCAKGGE